MAWRRVPSAEPLDPSALPSVPRTLPAPGAGWIGCRPRDMAGNGRFVQPSGCDLRKPLRLAKGRALSRALRGGIGPSQAPSSFKEILLNLDSDSMSRWIEGIHRRRAAPDFRARAAASARPGFAQGFQRCRLTRQEDSPVFHKFPSTEGVMRRSVDETGVFPGGPDTPSNLPQLVPACAQAGKNPGRIRGEALFRTAIGVRPSAPADS